MAGRDRLSVNRRVAAGQAVPILYRDCASGLGGVVSDTCPSGGSLDIVLLRSQDRPQKDR